MTHKRRDWICDRRGQPSTADIHNRIPPVPNRPGVNLVHTLAPMCALLQEQGKYLVKRRNHLHGEDVFGKRICTMHYQLPPDSRREDGMPVFVLFSFLPQLSPHRVPERYTANLRMRVHTKNLDRCEYG